MIKKNIFLFISVVFAWGASQASEPEVSLATLLCEMTDRSHLATWPSPAYTCAQFSSYDRASIKKGEPGWFNNFDQGQFIRKEIRNGQEEFVMMDVEGPGAIVRFWMTFSGINRGMAILRVYIDDYDVPAIEGNVREILSGGALVGKPMSDNVPEAAPFDERGHNLYFPIPYARRCKVTLQSPDLKIDDDGKIQSATIAYYA